MLKHQTAIMGRRLTQPHPYIALPQIKNELAINAATQASGHHLESVNPHQVFSHADITVRHRVGRRTQAEHAGATKELGLVVAGPAAVSMHFPHQKCQCVCSVAGVQLGSRVMLAG